MASEWLGVMLDEIARKREEARLAHEELERRRAAGEPLPPPTATEGLPEARRPPT